jgi:chromosome segregation ATPase
MASEMAARDTAERQCTELEGVISQQRRLLSEADLTAAALRAEVDSSLHAAAAARDSLVAMQRRLASAEDERSGAASDAALAQAEQEALHARCMRVTREAADLRAEVARLTAELRTARADAARAASRSLSMSLASEVGSVREGVRSVKSALAAPDPSTALRGSVIALQAARALPTSTPQ